MNVRVLPGPKHPPLYPRLAYTEACLVAERMSEVVCERCGLAQPYVTYEGEGTKVIPCAGPLGIGCGSETCVTIEAYADVHS